MTFVQLTVLVDYFLRQHMNWRRSRPQRWCDVVGPHSSLILSPSINTPQLNYARCTHTKQAHIQHKHTWLKKHVKLVNNISECYQTHLDTALFGTDVRHCSGAVLNCVLITALMSSSVGTCQYSFIIKSYTNTDKTQHVSHHVQQNQYTLANDFKKSLNCSYSDQSNCSNMQALLLRLHMQTSETPSNKHLY